MTPKVENAELTEIEKLVAFCVLMENEQGIIDKAPDYIDEKWRATQSHLSAKWTLNILDDDNRAKFDAWRKLWGTHDTD